MIKTAIAFTSICLLAAPLAAQSSRPASAPASRPASAPASSAPAASQPSREISRILIDRIEAAHGGDAWNAHAAAGHVLAGDLKVVFGGNTRIDGPFSMRPDTSGIRMTPKDGVSAVWTGDAAFVVPAVEDFPRARFHLLTWPYFLAAPFKFDDPGANYELMETGELFGETKSMAKLTFDSGVGDAPDDWYITYTDPVSGRLDAMAYIVTYGGKDPDAAMANAHAVVYDDFREVEGVVLPHSWSFYNWSEEKGVHGDPIGMVTLGDLAFRTETPGEFDKPEGAEEDVLPEG